jgi:hypothetical protein
MINASHFPPDTMLLNDIRSIFSMPSSSRSTPRIKPLFFPQTNTPDRAMMALLPKTLGILLRFRNPWICRA